MPHCFGGKDRGGLLGMDWDVLMQHSQIDLFGGLVATRAVAPYIEKEGGGAIVCTSCTAAWLDGGHYAVAKAGLNALVQSLARELGPKNIRINAIAPGMTDTAAMQEQVRPEWIESQLENLAIKRPGTPQDHAETVKFLLSDGGAFITGQIIVVDGGTRPS